MHVGIVGSRSFNDYNILKDYILGVLSVDNIDKIISGGAIGADKLGELFAKEFNMPIDIFKPDWDKHGKKAGFIRNTEIINNSEILFAFWDMKSKGTLDSINKAKEKNIPTHIVDITCYFSKNEKQKLIQNIQKHLNNKF